MNSCKIYPPIGVARVGNAPTKFYIGPETYRGLPILPSGEPFTEHDFRDDKGRLCRQAARFKIYRDTPQGPQEVTLDTPEVAEIRWTVHVANKKASWYEFQTNLGQNGYASNHPLRNAHREDRHELVIDPGPRSISGRRAAAVHLSRDSVPPDYQGAHFPPKGLKPSDSPQHPHNDINTLGELHTDAQGRLLFLGGLGRSGTEAAQPHIGQYANNDGWWDDTSDGPLHAEILLKDGSRIDCGTAWVVTAPPAYAPEIPNLVTLWDTIFDTAVRAGQRHDIFQDGLWKKGEHGYKPNFHTEIGPLLERGLLYAWVAAIPPKPHKFDMARLGAVPASADADENRSLRNWILQVLRPPGGENDLVSNSGRTFMPYLAGDNALISDTLTSKYLRLTDTQYFFLQQWAEGWFVNRDEAGDPRLALSRAVLENCVGGAFSPGIEMTWISRNSAIFNYPSGQAPRINAAMVAQGPLNLGFDPAQMQPGDVSRYMAVPWQADFNECSSQSYADGRVLWWWPAQRPEFVYLDHTQPHARVERGLEAVPEPSLDSGVQVPWLGTDFNQGASNFIQFADDVDMVRYWWCMGFVLGKKFKNKAGQAELRYVEVARRRLYQAHPPAKGE